MRGRLWRAANPHLAKEERQRLVNQLMHARRAVGAALKAQDRDAETQARAHVHTAKVALGERGPVWWTDGAPDENRTRLENSSYRGWWSVVQERD